MWVDVCEIFGIHFQELLGRQWKSLKRKNKDTHYFSYFFIFCVNATGMGREKKKEILIIYKFCA